jgi:hypothetical protein
VRDSYRVTGKLSRGNELSYGSLDRLWWVEILQEKILKGG